MSGDEYDTHGFDDVTHNVCCCISPEAVAEGKREAYIRGTKDYAEEVRLRARRMAGKRNAEYRDFGAAFMELEYETTRGEWPKETT
jgi:hypothetical protein